MDEWTRVPDLVGDHVRLTALRPEHADALVAAADDDEVFRWLTYRRPTDRAAMSAVIDLMLSRTPQQLAWTQVDQRTGDPVGVTTYYEIDPAQRSLAIGWTWLGSRAWRTGINTEAKLLLLTRAFETLGCVRVVWHTDHRNERSQAAIERLGATFEGSMRKHKQRPDGSWRDTFTYSMLDDEWPDAKARLVERLAR
ncbi:MAG: GNAT family protein [Aeromicrobium erythreum]